MTFRKTRRWVLGLAAMLALPASAYAQAVQLPAETSPLNAIKRLFCANFDGNGAFASSVGGGAVITPVSTNLVNEFLFQSQTFPNVSSSAGFTFNWVGGAPVASELYGPLFGERALTNGKNKLSATLNYQRLSWSSLDGQKIRADQVGLNWGDLNPVGLLPSDPYTGVCKLNVNSDVVLLALNYGLTRRLDVSAAVPFVHTSVSGTSEFHPAGSASVGNLPPRTFAASGDASGIGDVGVALKLGLLESGAFHVALRGGAGLGTGSADKMTGSGQTVLTGVAAATWERTPVSIHGQVGYSAATGTSDPASPLAVGVFDEVSYVVGLDYAPVPEKVTVGTELVARRLLNTPGFDAQTLTADNKDITVYFFSIGGKVRLVQRVLFTAYLLVPAGNSGLLPNKPSFNGGLNYVF
jgi:hypothetical protein